MNLTPEKNFLRKLSDLNHGLCKSTGGRKVAGGWKIGNYLDGCQAEYFVVPDAQANLALIPDNLTDEDVLLIRDIVGTGFSADEAVIRDPHARAHEIIIGQVP